MSWPDIPQIPELPAAQIGSGSTRPRYEDIAQDGRMRLEGIWPPMGPILWGGGMPIVRALTRLGAQGIRSVLARVVLWGGSDPISVRNPVEHELRYQLAHTVDDNGQVDRILFNTWLTSTAPRGVANDPGRPSPTGGERVNVARAWGQHVFTKPAAPAGQHRVRALPDPELPEVPESRQAFHDARDLFALPEGAEPLESIVQPDDMGIAFGLAHTDGNQHVNFLAYPRLAEDAALRRLASLGFGTKLLARHVEIAYRKPCFAGDRMRIVLAAFRHGEDLGAYAAFVPDRAPVELDKPHVTVRLLLSP